MGERCTGRLLLLRLQLELIEQVVIRKLQLVRPIVEPQLLVGRSEFIGLIVESFLVGGCLLLG